MANKKINELVTRTPSLTDLILVGDPSSGYSYKATVTALATIIETDIADGFVTLSTTQTISGAKTFTNAVLISANSPELNLNQGTSSASYINFKENSSLVNRIISSGATLTFITNNSGTAALVLSSSQTATFGSIPNATTDTDRFLVSDSGTLKYRTGAELLSDIGAASSSNISGTTNYIAKFTSSSAIGNSVIYESGGNIGISTTSLSAKLNVNGNAILTGSINATEVYLASPNGLVFQIDSSNTNGGYAEFQTNSTTIGRIGTATQVVGSGGTSVFAISSRGANDFVLGTNGTERVRIDTSGNVTFSQIANATTDTDKFLVSDGGVVKYRTGSEVLSDIGAASSASISGTTNYIPKFTSSSAIGDSPLYDASGSIGLNSTTPALNGFNREFTVNAGTSGTARAAINIQGSRTSASTFGVLGFYHQTTYVAGIESSRGGDATSGILQFFTSNTTGATERMRLDASGNLGLGTSSPVTLLDVRGEVSVAYNASYGIRFYNQDRNNWSFIGNSIATGNTSANLRLGDATGEVMRITGGNVGIGTTSPTSTLSVYSTAATNVLQLVEQGTSGRGSQIQIKNAHNTGYYLGLSGDTNGDVIQYNGGNTNMIFYTNALERMRITSGGDALIGTTSSILSGTNNRVLDINATSSAYIGFSTSGQLRGYIYADASSSGIGSYTNTPFTFITNNSERMRITSGGNVLVNKTNNGTGAVQVKHTDTNFYTGLSVYGTTADNFTSVGHTGSLGVISSTYNSTGSYTPLAFYTSDLERMRITSGGQLLINRTSGASTEELLGIQGATNSTAMDIQIGTNTYYGIRFRNSSGTQAGYIEIGASSVTYGTGSDYRLKQDLKSFNGLNLISQIPVYDFEWKVDSTRSYGVLAHELQSVIPYAVSGQKDALNVDGTIKPQGVDYSKIVPILIKSIQELKAEIETLKNK